MAVNVALRVWLPSDSTFHVVWIVPAVEAVLVVMLVTAHPGGVADHRRLRRPPSWSSACSSRPRCGRPRCSSTALIRGTGVSKSPSRLLASGAVVWLGNNLAFALLYRLMDGGGPVARRRLPVPVDFAFIRQLTPEIAPAGWRPVCFDYLHLGFTNATAFSPTDVLPLTHRAKYAMLVPSTVALSLFGLVVARAVNAFT